MLKYALIIVFTASSAQFAHADDRAAQDANDGTTEQTPPRKDVYKKLGITHGDSEPERDPAAQEQPQQQDDSGANTTAPHDTSEQPVN
jgi:hypothetical protein